MLDHLLAREEFREHLLAFVAATTGTTTLGASSVGYTRAAGSFVTDGFLAGWEVVPAGFPVNAGRMIQKVEPLTLTIEGGLSTAAAAGSRSLTVGLPLEKQWHGTLTPVTTQPATRPKLVEQWVPGSVEDDGAIVDTGFYSVTINQVANRGLAGPLRYMSLLRNHFPPGLDFEVGGDLVRVTGSPAPQFTQPITTDNGYESSTLSIPWRVMTTNLAPV